ncbi:ketopantoate reductase family protein [Aurantimonas marianensis]|uniref:2-dehydropantoate 2-reductase n=1 Tax=Aurantimonas marianensis TaxID=2920428 RepID=A0A9X2KFS2_9HYPH|nr:2-dehydropantoate 2-reductase [Aurantimonas marianensis]MCP3055676.1 2-dehydropantoate 2-reductase [Aurantimonas marianensis]
MPHKVLILGASYGSLLGTKLAMAGHDVTLLCRAATAALINDEGPEVRIRLRGEDSHRSVFSRDLPGRVDARTPEAVDPADYDLVCLAMQEPQYGDPALRNLLNRTADAAVPCMSIMNMPPLPYLKRLPGLDCGKLEDAYTDAVVWDRFDPALMTLCSPDPQAFRPPEEKANVLHVGLPTNFKVARFDNPDHDQLLAELAADIDAVRIDGHEVPVKLRVHDSLYVPLAKWSMLATGNYRCITAGEPISIRDAVHGDIELSREIYAFVNEIVIRLGASPDDQVPFEKYAKAAENLLKPSSAARAVAGGATTIERVDKLVQRIGLSLGMEHPALNATVDTVDRKLAANSVKVAA